MTLSRLKLSFSCLILYPLGVSVRLVWGGGGGGQSGSPGSAQGQALLMEESVTFTRPWEYDFINRIQRLKHPASDNKL